MIPREMNPLEIILEGLEESGLHFERDKLSGFLFNRACTYLDLEGYQHPLMNEDISYKIIRYATDILVELDSIRDTYSNDLYLFLDADGNYEISIEAEDEKR